MMHSYWRKWTRHSIKKWNNSIKALWRSRVQADDIRDRSPYMQVKRVHQRVQQPCRGPTGQTAFPLPLPLLSSLRSHALSSSLCRLTPVPNTIIFHFPFSFPLPSPSFFNGPPRAPLSLKPAIFYLHAQLRERRRLEQKAALMSSEGD